ncbi:scabin-related ADP-ribosyltransferase [Pseudomonas jessenii]|uniref:scabin-related ADP-ribosyltransferase n=1 Tax=Pseudomonas jessenii TaxID=77298 RepID=UPI0032E3D1DE
MVAIVAGNGLGLFNASLNSLGGSGVGGQGNLGQAGGQALVNVSNGNLVLRFTDEQLSGLGQDLLQTRTYNTQGGLSDGDADGWRWDGERSLVLIGTVNTPGSQVTRTTGDGHQTVYQWNGSRYQSTEGDGAHDTVTWDADAGQMVWTDGSRRLVERYDNNGRLLSVTDANGTEINYGYGANGRLNSVKDSSGQELVLNYNASGKLNRVDTRSAAGGALTQQVYYGYDAQGRLIKVSTDLSPADNSNVDGYYYNTDYTYDAASFRIASVVQSDGTSASFTYQLLNGEYRIKTVTDNSGTTAFSYDIANRRTDVLNGLGQQWSYIYDTSDRLIEVQTPAVNGQRLSTSYAYDLDGNVIKITDGRGNAVTYQYDANGNALLERDATGATVARTYNADNQLLNEIRYSTTAILNSTTGLWTEPPASTAQVTRLTYDSNNRVRFTVDGRGQVTEYRYNPEGLRVQEISYGDALFAVTGLTPKAVLTESQLVTWTGARNRIRSTLTELSYDYRGNLSRRVTYGAVNAAGVGTQNSSTSVTEYIYNQHGQLLQTLVTRGADRSRKITLSSVVYDGQGRVISQTDSSGTRTTYYSGTNRAVAVTNSAGLTVTQTYDSKGQLLGLTQTAAGQTPRSTSYVYDAAGRQIMVQDATGVRSYTFYDEAGRVSALVDGVGAVIEYSYNAAGQRVQEKRYATLVDTAAWYNGTAVLKKLVGEVRPVNTSADRLTTLSYDNAGRLSTSADAGGTLTTFTYDGQGQLIKQQTGDRTTRFFYDASGHQSGQLDAEGYLRENRYDAAGRLTQSIRYASVTLVANRASGTLGDLRQTSADDLSSWYYYDTAGRQIGSVDEKQFVTETVYDEAANTQKTIRYAMAYTAAISDATVFSTIKAVVAASATQTATTFFDDLGRVARRVAIDGTTTAYEYDSAGRLVREIQAQGSTDERNTRTRYDAFGQTIGKLLGEASERIKTGMSDTEVAAIYAQYGLTYQYDAAGRVASASDALGNRTLSYYDAAGRLTHVVNALGEVSETVYSSFGEARERTDFTGRLSVADNAALSGGVLNAQVKTLVQAIRNAVSDNRRVYDYDNRGLLTSTTDAQGYVTRNGYNAFGNQTSATRTISTGITVVNNTTYNKRGEQIGRIEDIGGLARSSTTAYDAFGRVISQTDGRGLSNTTTYSSNGRVITLKNPLDQGQTSEYDAFGRVLKQTDALGNTTTYAYNDSARSLTVTTPDGVSVVTIKNRHGQTLMVTNGTGAVTRFSYNKDGQLITNQDGLNQVTTNAYDAAGRLLTVTDALGQITRYGYDAGNRVLTRTDANNSVTRYSFDGQGRQVRVVEAEGKGEQRITDYAYDRNGQQLRVTQDPNGLKLTTSYSYDGLGQQVQVMRGTVASPNQQITLYEFDKLGRRISERLDPSGLNQTTQYRYNGNDQVTRKIDAAGNSTLYVYDAAGRLSSTVDALGFVSENKYDNNGQVIETVRYATPIQIPTIGSSDGRTLSMSGDSRMLTALEKIAINPARTYTVRVKLRQVTGEGVVYAGVVTYDSAGNAISNPYAGNFAYNAAAGVKLTPEMGWQTFEGTISGTNPINANANRSKFFEGSVSAVPLLLFNYYADSSGDASRLIEVDSLELIDTATGQVLNVNANTEAGQANWSVAGPVGVHGGNEPFSAEHLQALLRPDSNDRRTQFIYDAVGRQRYVIDGQGAVTENKYDANGRLTETVQYATRIQLPTAGSSDGRTLSMSGDTRMLTALEKIAINPARTYTVRVKLRQVTGEGNIYAGVVTYDSAGNAISNPYASTFTYNAAAAMKLTPEMGWRTFEGTISGTNPINASASRSKFFEGSVSAVPLLLFNYGADSSGDASRLIEVDSLELIDTATGQVLNVNANTEAGQANWSVAGPVGVHGGNEPFSAEHLQALLRPDSNDRRTQFIYDAVGRQRYVIDGQGAVTENKYDANGRLTETVQYATRIQLPTAGSSDGRTLSMSGDTRMLTALEKIAINPARTYTVRVKLRQVTGEGNIYAGVVTYDSAGNAISNPYASTFTYNAAAAMKLTPEMGWRTFEGTISGTNPINASASRSKFFEGSVSAVPLLLFNYGADSSGDASRLIEVDSLELIDTATGQVLNVNANADAGQANWSVAGPVGVHGGNEPFSAEHLQALLRPDSSNDRTTTYTYDAVGRQKTVTDAAGKVETYTYDAVGNRKTLTNKNGHVWTYNYDTLNRLVEEITPAVYVASITETGVVSAATGYLVTSITYDALGNVTSRSEGRQRTRVSAAPALDDLSQTRTTTYAYDAASRQIRTTSPGWYNKLSGQYQQSSDGTANTFQVSTEVTYDTLGNAVRNRVRINNSGVAAADFVDSYKVYDVLGRVSHDIDALKGVTAYTYDGLGQTTRTVRYANALTKAVPARGYYLGADLTAATLVPSATQDRTLTTSYDTLGRKTAVQQNPVSLYTFTGNVATSTLTTLAPTTLYNYDAFGQLVRETQVARDAGGATVQTGASTVYYYDLGGQRIGSVDALGYYTRMEYDALGQQIRQTEYATKLTSWNESALPTASTSANDRRSRFTYDDMGRLSQTTLEGATFWQQSINAATGAVSATLVTADLLLNRSTYDGVGNVKTVTDAQGNVVSTDYNALGQVLKVTEPTRATAKNNIVDPFANAIVTASPTITYLLNAFGQQIREVRAAGTDSAGNVQAGVGQITRTRYDAAGYEIQEINAAGSSENYKVDIAGRRLEESRQINVTMSAWITVFGVPMAMDHTTRRTFEYDTLGQQIATVDWYTVGWDTKVSARENALYNRFGEVTRKEVNGGVVDIFNYDQAGRLESNGNATSVTAYQYDLSGKVSKSTVLGDWSTTTDDRINYMRNDLLGRTFEQHLPAFEANLSADTLNSATLTLSTPIIRQTTDRWGNVLSRTDARGYITSYTYNQANQVLTETLPVADILRENGTGYRASLIHEKRYDVVGRLIQEADLVGPYTGVATSTLLRTRQHVYNQVGQLIRDVDALGSSRQYLYDIHGNRVSTQDALGTVLVDSYDVMDQQINHGIIRNGAKLTLLTNKYDQAGRLYAEISGTVETAETLRNVEDGREGSSYMSGVLGNTRYTVYNERGNITHSNNESGVMFSYEYDALNRKTLEQDELGSTKTWTYSAGDASRLVGYKDWGGHTYTYTYNDFGELEKEQIGNGPDKTHHYFANGLTKFVIEGPAENWAVTGSEYDLAGNKVREFNSTIITSGAAAGGASFETFYKYDAQGKLTGVRAPAGTQHVGLRDMRSNTARIDALTYSYDELGNRRRVILDTTNQDGARTVIDNWFKYDLEGRVLVEDGFLSSRGQVVADVLNGKAKGEAHTYDAAGNRTSTGGYSGVTEDLFGTPIHGYALKNYTYNDLGSLLTIVKSESLRDMTSPDPSSNEWSSTVTQIFSAQYDARNNRVSQEDINGTERTRTTYTYRGDGKLNNQLVTRWNGSSWKAYQYTFFNETRKIGADGVERDSTVGYDAAGRSVHYRYTVYDKNGGIAMWGENQTTHAGFDTWKELIIQANINSGTNSRTTMGYSARGELLTAVANGSTAFNRRFASDRNGQLTIRSEGNTSQRYATYNGNVLASIGNNSTPEIFDTIASILPEEVARTPSSYVIVDGDTLQSIAQKTWGDSSMWYLIADANGLNVSDSLVRGTSLVIPNVTGSNANNADTFKAYDQSEVTGDLTPVPIYKPPKPKKKKSGGLASVVMVVVAVVATVFTAGAALYAMGATGSFMSIGATAMTMGGVGTAALGSSAIAAGVVGLGVGAAAGSAASQLSGMAMGVQDKFSWSQVAVSGLSGAVVAGLSGMAQAGQMGPMMKGLVNAGGSFKYTTQGVFNYTASQAANRIAGLDTSFSWSSLASSIAAANISGQLNGRFGDQLPGQVLKDQLGAHVAAAMSDKWLGGARPNYGQVAVDAFGNTLGNFIADQIRQPSAEMVRKAQELAGLPGDEATAPVFRRALANGATPEMLGKIYNDPELRPGLLHPTKPGENGSYLRYDGDGVWVGVPPPQEPLTYSVDNLEGVVNLNGNSTLVEWANNVTPLIHEGLTGIASFAKAHEGATELIGFAAQAVSYTLMGPMAAMRDIATQALLGPVLDQARDYAIERVSGYYQSKGVHADNADTLASGTLFGVETVAVRVTSAVIGAQHYVMRMSAKGVPGSVAGTAESGAGAVSEIPTYTFRGDTREPDVIFNEGFQSRGDSKDLMLHALDSKSPPSMYVPTSRSLDVASDFDSNVYVVRQRGGIDINAVLGSKSPFPEELEIAIPGGVRSIDIRALTLPDQGVSILNPNFRK